MIRSRVHALAHSPAAGSPRALATTASASHDELVASSAKMRPLAELAKEQWRADSAIGIEPYAGWAIGKLQNTNDLTPATLKNPGKLVLVSAMTPTKFGEGKTCTSVGLTDALRRIGKRATVCLREPSLGPVFGMKGGAAGGGKSQLVPMEDINLHFTGDIHAVSSANNLLAAMIDNSLHFPDENNIDPRRITFKRVLDMQDRSLRSIVVGLGGPLEGVPRQDSFDISVASEVMAILCLATDLKDLQERLGRIVIGSDRTGKKNITAKDLQVNGAMTALLTQAFRPNVVQSLENTLALVHGGPFANIAHGCSSVKASTTALGLSDYVVTEAGFGADLGAEKFLHIKCRQSGLRPSCSVVVATVRAMKMHGGWTDEKGGSEADALKALRTGSANLLRHVRNLEKFGLKSVVAVNKFPTDTEAELQEVVKICEGEGVEAVVATHYSTGGSGAEELAKKVVRLADGNKDPQLKFMYDLSDSLETKVDKVAREIYRAKGCEFSNEARNKLKRFEAEGFGNLPICIAKTQYSFSDNAKLLNAPEGHTLHVQDAKLSAGAGFVVILTGSVMTMPGLPRVPAAKRIGVDGNGKIFGLF